MNSFDQATSVEEILPDAEKRKLAPYPRLLEEHIAFHLAGRAVISQVLKVSIERISVFPELYRGSIEHPRYQEGPYGILRQTELEWRKQEPSDFIPNDTVYIPRSTVVEAHAMILLAGQAAERLFCDNVVRFKPNICTRDIARLVSYGACDRKRLKRKATALVANNSLAVLTVARRLTVHTSLIGTQLEDIVRPLLSDQTADI